MKTKQMLQCAVIQTIGWILFSVTGHAFSGYGLGLPEVPYEIETVDQLQEIGADLNAHYVLVSDIDASATAGWNGGTGFVPIGTPALPFTGSLDGQGYSISDLTIERLGYSANIGLFGRTSASAVIENLTLLDASVRGTDYVGSLVGFNVGLVLRCYASGVVRGGGSFGGLIGHNDGRVEHCAAHVEVSGANHLGGLVGINKGLILNAYATGSVSGYENPGGLSGVNYGTIENCYATGNVTTSFSLIPGYYRGAGGLVGQNHPYGGAPGILRNCFSTGNVTGPDIRVLGGLVGVNTLPEPGPLPQIINCYYNHTAGNPPVAVGSNQAGSILDITKVEDNEVHFFNNANAPLSSWDFAWIWAFENGLTDLSYPIFRYMFPDTVAPVIESVSADPAVLWPPNNKMVMVTISVVATDDQDPYPVSRITGVDVADTGYKGKLSHLIKSEVGVINGLTVYLRASRTGAGNGRTYMVNIACSDAHGNTTYGSVAVKVPHDKRPAK